MKSQRGYTLITTILIMVILFVIGVAGAMLIYYGNLTSGAMINYSKAYYNADYGIQKAIYNVSNMLCNCQNDGCGFTKTMLAGGSVNVYTTSDSNGKTCFVESIGTGQTGGYVAKAIAISGNTSNWGAAGMLNGINLNLFGSMSINGCDLQNSCEAAGLIAGGGMYLSNVNLQTCNNIQNPNNPKGLLGSPPLQQTGATDVSSLITQFQNFSNLENYLQTLACPPNGSSCLNPPSNNIPSNCICNGSAYVNSGNIIMCGNQQLSNSCSTYYINGAFNINTNFNLTNQTLYATAINSNNNLTLQNSKIISNGATNINGSITATNSQIYIQNGSIGFNSYSQLQGSIVYVQNGDVYFNTANGQNVTADLCGGQTCNSSVESIVFAGGGSLGAGAVFVNGPIQGGLIYGDGGITINGVNGNRSIGTSTEPVVYVSNLGTNANINMSGTTKFNGLILANNLASFNIGNNSINGAFYVTNTANLNIGGNASINFNYAILSEIYNAFPNIFNPVACNGNPNQWAVFNTSTLY